MASFRRISRITVPLYIIIFDWCDSIRRGQFIHIVLYLVNTWVCSVEQWVTMVCRLLMLLTRTSHERKNGVPWRRNEWTGRGRSRRGGRGCDDRRVVTACCLLADLYRGESTSHTRISILACMYVPCVFIHAINYVHCRHSRRTLCVHTAMLFMRSRVHAIRTNVIRSIRVSFGQCVWQWLILKYCNALLKRWNSNYYQIKAIVSLHDWRFGWDIA